jgi:tetratricopeptide (TPR) repeat protein
MSDRALELKHQGNRALVRRDYEGSAKAFRELIQLSPDSPDGYIGLAKVLERTHEHQAIVDLLEPASRKVQRAGVLKSLGNAYRVLARRGQAGVVDRGIEVYEAYLAQREDPVILFYLAGLYRLKKEYGEALSRLRRSWALDPGSESVYAAALECARRVGHDESLKEIESWSSAVRR